MSACIRKKVASHPNLLSPLRLYFSPICPDNCDVVFLWKYFSFREMIFFVRLLKYANFHREYYPSCVTNILDHQYFCQHNPLFYHLNLILCHYWSWQSHIYFLVNIFVWHTFPMSNSSIKRKTIVTITDMTESTELQAFTTQKDG